MSEQRQLALLLVGLVVLAAVGIVGATLFPEGCEDLQQAGQLELRFADADAALPLSAEDGAAVQALGTELGIGEWRGAVALPGDAVVSPSEFGFFVVTSDDFTVLRPGLGIASAARGRVLLDAVPAGTSLALRDRDGTTAVVNSEYEVDRCGELPVGTEVLSVDRGFAVVRDGEEVALVTLSGDEVWRAPDAGSAHVVADRVVLGRPSGIELRDVRTGDVLDTAEASRAGAPPWVHAAGDRVLVLRGGELVPVSFTEDTFEVGDPLELPVRARDGATTPGGVVVAGDADGGGVALASDRAPGGVALPDGLAVADLYVSEDGHVGVLVSTDQGDVALLVYGPDRPPT